jgi:HK97 family phage prohead protease/HK97 family phage major capsid protein
MAERFDFSGWATRNNLKCSDGRIIRRDAFKDNDADVVPLIWQHDHNSPANVIGHALLENRDDGVYAYCALNNSERGRAAKEAVLHGDIDSLSIYANKLTQNGPDVIHGVIREVSLVMHGANPGAYIDNIIQHSDGSEVYGEEGAIYNDESINTEKAFYLCHAGDGSFFISENEEDEQMYEDEYNDQYDDSEEYEDDQYDDSEEYEDDQYDDSEEYYEEDGGEYYDDEFEHADNDDETVADVFDAMTDKQKMVVYFMVGQALEKAGVKHSDEDYEGGNYMMHNVFDQSEPYIGINSADPNAIMHGEELMAETDAMFAEAIKKGGSLRDTILQHAATYGIDDIDFLFPDAKNYTTEPEIISRNMEWTTTILGGVKHSPFSRIKTIFADITADEARARGYVKGARKIEEVFKLLKRQVVPTTIYKKQKFDRDDILDVTSFDVVAFVRKEMRVMLNEEIARAILIGDGRDPVQDPANKIDETKIIPIYTDDELFSIQVTIPVAQADTSEAKAKNLIKAVIRARKDYKGSGNPTFYCTADVLADMLLVEDGVGRRLYRTKEELATALLVSKIVTVEPMQGITRDITTGEGQQAVTVTRTLAGIIVNPADYVVGADKGGEINTFDDFDINYNQMLYLMETRISGMLTKPKSAMVVEFEPAQG